MANVRSITPLPPADFTPELGNYKTLQPFRYWCQKVLPLVYDDSLSYYELLCKVVDFLNKTMEDVENLHTDDTKIYNAYVKLQQYVNDYFKNLDLQEEINKKLDDMYLSGELTSLVGSVRFFDTTVKALSANLIKHSIVYTGGYSSINDGGNACFYVSETPSNLSLLNNTSNLYLNLIYNDTIYSKQLNATDGNALSNILLYANLCITENITLTETIICSNSRIIDIGGHILSGSINTILIKNTNNVEIKNGSLLKVPRGVLVYNCDTVNIHDLSISAINYTHDLSFCIGLEKVNNVTVHDCNVFSYRDHNLVDNIYTNGSGDGIHFFRACYNCKIYNIMGSTGDDFIALNARESLYNTSGSIQRISFDNIISRGTVVENAPDSCFRCIRMYGRNNTEIISDIKFTNCNLINDTFSNLISNDINYSSENDSVVIRRITFENCSFNTLKENVLNFSFYRVTAQDYVNFINCNFCNISDTSIITQYNSYFKRLTFNGCDFSSVTNGIVIKHYETEIKNYTYIDCSSNNENYLIQIFSGTINNLLLENINTPTSILTLNGGTIKYAKACNIIANIIFRVFTGKIDVIQLLNCITTNYSVHTNISGITISESNCYNVNNFASHVLGDYIVNGTAYGQHTNATGRNRSILVDSNKIYAWRGENWVEIG